MEGFMQSASGITDSGLEDRGPQLTVPTYVNATPSGELQLRVVPEPVLCPAMATTSTGGVASTAQLNGQPRTAERGLLYGNQIQGALTGANNEQAFLYNADIQTRGSQSRVPTTAGRTTREMASGLYYPSQGTSAYPGEDAYGRLTIGADAVAPGSGFPGGQMRGRPEARNLPTEMCYGVQNEAGYVPETWNRHDGNNSGPRYRKPSTYDGKTGWQDYSVQFEIVAELNRWGERTKALELATSLRGAALTVLSELRPELRMSYRDLVFALQARFEPTNQSELYRTQIKNRIRKKDEALPELAQDVKRLVRLAYPEAAASLREHLSKDCFTDALNDSELEWAVFQGKAQTVEDAVRIGLEYEAFQAGHRRHAGAKSSVRMQHGVSGDNAMSSNGVEKDALADVFGRLAKIEAGATQPPNWRPSSYPRSGACHICGDTSHWKRECPNRPRDGERTQYRSQPSFSQRTPARSEN
jgi:hypothetical protein